MNVKRISIALALIMTMGLSTGCGTGNKQMETKTNSSSEVKVAGLEGKMLNDVCTGISDTYVLKDSRDIDYLKKVLYDGSIVKDIKVDITPVAAEKEDTYKITYEITFDKDAFNDYLDKTAKSEEEKLSANKDKVVFEKVVTVVSKDKAQDLADKDTPVYKDGNETVNKSDGTEVKEEQKIPSSTEVTDGPVINASTKEEVKGSSSEDSKSDSKNETADKKEDTDKTSGSGSKNDSSSSDKTSSSSSGKTDSSSSSSSKPGSNSGSSSSKPSSSSGSSSSSSKPGSNSGSSSSKPSSSSGSSSSSSKPSHTHTWVNITKTVHHPAVTHQEDVYENKQVLVSDAWDEQVVTGRIIVCSQCRFTTTDQYVMDDHLIEYAHSCHWDPIYSTVHHDAVYQMQRVKTGTKTVVDKAAWDEEVVTGQRCSSCGATK